MKDLKFHGKRLDLEVYHLAYGTKKLRKCTYERMKKRQQRKNREKALKITVKTPEEAMEKGEKVAWLNDVEALVSELPSINKVE